MRDSSSEGWRPLSSVSEFIAPLRSIRANRARWTLIAIIYQSTGRMSGLVTKSLPVNVGSPERTHYRVTLAALTLGAIAYALLQSLVLPALPEMQDSLHVSQATVTWVLTSCLLSASVATPIAGRLGDMYGKHRLLVIVLALLAFGTVISAASSSIGLLLAGRVLQGIGGGIFPLAFGMIRDEFPPSRVAGGHGLCRP
jgi:predicted MFS family arabinose efflux permease